MWKISLATMAVRLGEHIESVNPLSGQFAQGRQFHSMAEREDFVTKTGSLSTLPSAPMVALGGTPCDTTVSLWLPRSLFPFWGAARLLTAIGWES